MGTDVWWDWRADGPAKDEERRGMEDLEELAGRCVVIDNLAPVVKLHTVRTALGQFGTVLGVKMMINPWDMKFIGVAIAEMQSKSEQEQVIRELHEYLFMVGAMPRPARAIAATPKELLDHPWRRNPNRTRTRLVSRTNPGATLLSQREKADRLKVDDEEVMQSQYMELEEIKLAKMQETQCQGEMEKLNMIAKEHKNGTIQELKRLHAVADPRKS